MIAASSPCPHDLHAGSVDRRPYLFFRLNERRGEHGPTTRSSAEAGATSPVRLKARSRPPVSQVPTTMTTRWRRWRTSR